MALSISANVIDNAKIFLYISFKTNHRQRRQKCYLWASVSGYLPLVSFPKISIKCTLGVEIPRRCLNSYLMLAFLFNVKIPTCSDSYLVLKFLIVVKIPI